MFIVFSLIDGGVFSDGLEACFSQHIIQRCRLKSFIIKTLFIPTPRHEHDKPPQPPDCFRHHQPPFQPRADTRLRRLSRIARPQAVAFAQCRSEQGQSFCHHCRCRRQHRRRPDFERPHRRGAHRRPSLAIRPLSRRHPRRPALRARQRRHERLYRRRARRRARDGAGRIEASFTHCLVIR